MKDLKQMSDDELILYGLDLMLESLKVVFDKDAKEHKDFDEYVVELKKRRLNEKKDSD